jgi:Domain of unknown function (DUF5655)
MTVAAQFERADANVRAIYQRLLVTIRAHGPVTEDVKKTSIHLVRRTAFAGVAVRRSSIILTLKSRSDIRIRASSDANGSRRIVGTWNCVWRLLRKSTDNSPAGFSRRTSWQGRLSPCAPTAVDVLRSSSRDQSLARRPALRVVLTTISTFMNLHVPPELEAELDRLAAATGRPAATP